jgi:DNA-binding NarL/FixJ family response regulator
MLDFGDQSGTSPASFDQMLLQPDCIDEAGAMSVGKLGANFGIEFRQPAVDLSSSGNKPLRIGLIDCHRFSQECLVKTFGDLQPRFTMLPFSSVQDCIVSAPEDFDLVIYYSHGSEMESMKAITTIRQSFEAVPLIVLSDAEDAHQPKAICSSLKQGAHGFIPTRTMGIPMIVAAIQFVKAGGTFAPLDLLLTPRPDPVREAPSVSQQSRLTSRQVMVLGHLQQGKANKIIAHELGMSESTVKVHVRNIMRKMGATNRTQAAYKAQNLWGAPALRR